MADQQTEVGSAPDVAETATDGGRVDTRAAIIAELEAADKAADAAAAADDKADKTKKPPVEPKKPDAKAAAADVGEDDDTEVDDDDIDDPDVDLDDDAELGKDPETARRMAAVKKAEERSRAELARERTEFERERTSHKERLDRFERLAARAKYAPAEVLAELGLSEEDFDAAARDVYARSKQFANDPKNKEAAARLLREREDRDRTTKTERELAELREQLAKRETEARASHEVAQYMGSVEQLVTSDTCPLIAKQLEKNPAKARAGLERTALELAQKLGRLPAATKVVAAYEKQRRTELEEHGIDVTPYLKTKLNNLAADKKKTATTLDTTDPAAKTPPRSAPKSQRDLRAETLAALEAGNLDG